MIENYQDVMNEWGNPPIGCCSGTMQITPEVDLHRWAVTQTITVLANADYYYTKAQVDKIIQDIIASSVTKEEVEEMIARAISTKADKVVVDALAEQVRQNTEKLLNTYTKEETNSLLTNYLTKLEALDERNKYAAISGTTLTLNNELEITI